MPTDSKAHTISDPEVLRGNPRSRGTRIPVGMVLGYLASGTSTEELISEFPDLTREPPFKDSRIDRIRIRE
jgi:uncharacterized protein (DUF433 family)